ncbi:branched-chain amino acid ABC transporter permease [Pseudokineococcus lusitanus]|uniref:Branched-chain amino acid transport system permease protein n=1 Tax=Pseudokineococcus lusitanus TaxID=763993 RepID=A0A3N1HSC1_9ACTN|nr:branched-chain amino acid ABC transporter permease [Pseudokineococcus lusitanus]ROP45421.1 branched-chain amino acid transport system permease protein [Pseudokineococcus lusitanus]
MDWSSILSDAARSAIGLETVIYGLAAIGLNVQFGYAGLLNFGQAAFVAIGAYGLAITVTVAGFPFFVGLAVGLVGAVLLAVLLGIPTLRLRADYLAIATIAAAEIVRLVVRSSTLREQTGGSSGLTGFAEGFYALNPLPRDTYGFGPWQFSERLTWILLVGWVLVALSCLVVFLLMRSPWGRVLKGIREDEDAVRSLGKNVYAYKMQALVLGGVIGALAGFVFAVGRASVQPDLYGTELTFFVYTVLLLGGAARVFGPVVGAAIFWVVLSLTQGVLVNMVNAGYMPSWLMTSTQVGQFRFMLVGLALMLLMIYRPQGIFGDRRELAIDAR